MTTRILIGCEESAEVRDAFAGLNPDADVWSCDVLPTDRTPAYVLHEDGREEYSRKSRYPNTRHYQGDILGLFDWNHPVNREAQRRAVNRFYATGEPPEYLWDVAVLFPPCTHLTQGGARYFREKDARRGGDGRMQEGAAFFLKMTQVPAAAWAIENPPGVMCRPADPADGDLAVGYRRPDQVVSPPMFGDPKQKKICLWLQGLPPLVADNPVEPEGRVCTGGGSHRGDYARNGRSSNTYEDSRGRRFRSVMRSRTSPDVARAMAEQWTRFIREQAA